MFLFRVKALKLTTKSKISKVNEEKMTFGKYNGVKMKSEVFRPRKPMKT